MEDPGSLDLLRYGDDDEGNGDDEEQQLSAQPATGSNQEDLKDPEYRIESR